MKGLTWTMNTPDRHVGSMIFLVHSCDDWFVHGRSVTGAALSCYASRLSLSDPEPEPLLNLWKKTRRKNQISILSSTTNLWQSSVKVEFHPCITRYLEMLSDNQKVPTINPTNIIYQEGFLGNNKSGRLCAADSAPVGGAVTITETGSRRSAEPRRRKQQWWHVKTPCGSKKIKLPPKYYNFSSLGNTEKSFGRWKCSTTMWV